MHNENYHFKKKDKKAADSINNILISDNILIKESKVKIKKDKKVDENDITVIENEYSKNIIPKDQPFVTAQLDNIYTSNESLQMEDSESLKKKHKKKRKLREIECQDSLNNEIDDIKIVDTSCSKKKKRSFTSEQCENSENDFERHASSQNVGHDDENIMCVTDTAQTNEIEKDITHKKQKKKKKKLKKSMSLENIIPTDINIHDINESNKFNKKQMDKKRAKGKKIDIDNSHSLNEKEETSKNEKKNSGRNYTISIAVPASILGDTYLLEELRTYVVGQIARSACIYCIDEIIVYDDGTELKDNDMDYYISMMKMLLEYQECPQYLRKSLIPVSPFLRQGGILNALNAPHHLRIYDWREYREGVVVKPGPGKTSLTDVGFSDLVSVGGRLEPGVRVTVRLPPETKKMKDKYGFVVSPDEPRKVAGLYWGYTVRVAKSISEVLKSDRFKKGYDLLIGTSDRGQDSEAVSFPQFSHALIVFGGVNGLESALDHDKTLEKKDPKLVFRYYLNVCPSQGSRTIRTEEAILIALSNLTPKLRLKGNR